MRRERAKTFADRLPPLVPKEEPDISHLSDEMVDILYPGRRPRPFRIGLVFDVFSGPAHEKAVALAQLASVYKRTHHEGSVRHQADFEASGARALRDLFDIVGHLPGTEVMVDGKRVPYAREIWLPLFWLFVEGDS